MQAGRLSPSPSFKVAGPPVSFWPHSKVQLMQVSCLVTSSSLHVCLVRNVHAQTDWLLQVVQAKSQFTEHLGVVEVSSCAEQHTLQCVSSCHRQLSFLHHAASLCAVLRQE